MNMKWNVLFVILAVLLLAGCAQKTVEEDTAPVVEDDVEDVVEVVEPEPHALGVGEGCRGRETGRPGAGKVRRTPKSASRN